MKFFKNIFGKKKLYLRSINLEFGLVYLAEKLHVIKGNYTEWWWMKRKRPWDNQLYVQLMMIFFFLFHPKKLMNFFYWKIMFLSGRIEMAESMYLTLKC